MIFSVDNGTDCFLSYEFSIHFGSNIGKEGGVMLIGEGLHKTSKYRPDNLKLCW